MHETADNGVPGREVDRAGALARRPVQGDRAVAELFDFVLVGDFVELQVNILGWRIDAARGDIRRG